MISSDNNNNNNNDIIGSSEGIYDHDISDDNAISAASWRKSRTKEFEDRLLNKN